MSDGSLTQDEIDALLQGSSGFDLGQAGGGGPAAGGEAADLGPLKALLEGAIPAMASNLSLLVSKTAEISPPTVEVTDRDGLALELDDEVVLVSQNFSDGLLGTHFFILPRDSAASIAGLMMGQGEVELNEAALSALQESISQISGPLLTALGDRLKSMVMTDPAEALLVSRDDLACPDGDFVVASYPVAIEGEVPAKILEIFTLEQAADIAGKGGAGPAPKAAAPQKPAPGRAPTPPGAFPGPGAAPGYRAPSGSGGMHPPSVQPVQFPGLQQGHTASEHGNISLLMDVYMEMTVELGRTKKLIKEILGMGEGTIIELDKLAGEPVDILVNHKLIAKGEVVVIDENFGVRVTEIVSLMERMKDLT